MTTPTPAYTPEEVAALRRAIALGVRRVRYESGGETRETIYRDLSEMREILASMEAEIAGRPAGRTMLASYTRRR